MRSRTTAHFDRSYQKAPKKIQQPFDKQVLLLLHTTLPLAPRNTMRARTSGKPGQRATGVSISPLMVTPTSCRTSPAIRNNNLPHATKEDKTGRITIILPVNVLKDVDWLAPLEDMTREELILQAVKRFPQTHLEIRKQGLKAPRQQGQNLRPF